MKPADLNGLNLYGAVLNALERYHEAAEVFSATTKLQPQTPQHWMNFGTALRADGNLDKALAAYAHAASLGEASADFFYNVGLLHIDRGDYETAMDVLRKAVVLAPADAEICFHYAQCCNDCQRNDEAISALRQWQTFDGLSSELTAKIGLLLLNLGEPRLAEAAVSHASRDSQPTVLTTLKLAQIFERTNRLAEARQRIDRLKFDPHANSLGREFLVTEAQLAQRETHHEKACELFSRALQDNVDFHSRHIQLFPLAKSLDALKRYADAFAAVDEAHRSQLAMLELTAPEIASHSTPTLYITQRSCSAEDLAIWNDLEAPSAQESPVFIVAFPRSGTTLLEQALDAHPSLCSMDEQPFLQNAIDLIIEQKVVYPSELGRLSNAQLRLVRARYWELARKKIMLSPGQRLLDKNPLNLLRLPAIRRLFPNARILLAIRHPCDIILSCYMQHFTAPEFVLLCRDLPTLAAGYRQAFDFWYQQAALLHPAVHEIRYEALVSNFKAHLHDIANFLELPWDDAMLAPAEHARAKGFISTPSYSQVIQPVNQKSVGRWKNYEEHFVNALPIVKPYLEKWGYE
jgi:Flp pilus assembly protein TadD